jgi:hypothetical protein
VGPKHRGCSWIATLFAACAPVAPPAPPSTSASPAALAALTWQSCGPTDGPARSFELVVSGRVECTVHDSIRRGTRYELGVSTGLGAMPTGEAIPLVGNRGEAFHCAGAECTPLTGATLTLDPRGGDASTTTGTLTVTDHGVTTSWRFRAVECAFSQSCG